MKPYGLLCALLFTIAGCAQPPPAPVSNSPYSGSPPNTRMQMPPVIRNQSPTLPPAPTVTTSPPPQPSQPVQPVQPTAQQDTYPIQSYIGGLKQINQRERLIALSEGSVTQSDENNGRHHYDFYESVGHPNWTAIEDFQSEVQRDAAAIEALQQEFQRLSVPPQCTGLHTAYQTILATESQCLREFHAVDFVHSEDARPQLAAIGARYKSLVETADSNAQSQLTSLGQQYRIPIDFSIDK